MADAPRPAGRFWPLARLLGIERPRQAVLEELESQRLEADGARALVVQGLLESCGSLWGGACDCASRPGGCRCRGCPMNSSSGPQDKSK
mmetsp:Transcript_17311/g.40628  ORF Transcript_17311/g.40628 Transcript_17311/m.40628 type:complete len:89 (+) Transcript_17311:1-267(+)